MSGKNKNLEIEKVIQKDGNLNKSFNLEITSNTSQTPDIIPDFTTGDGDKSNDSSSSEEKSAE